MKLAAPPRSESIDSIRLTSGGGLAVRPLVVAWVVPLSLMVVALLVRLYNLELTGTVPDTYERLFDAKRIAAGELPASTIYPPGFAVLIAPFFLVLPGTIATMQAVIIGASIALVFVGYVWTVNLTRDRLAASMLAFAVALCPLLVYASRVAYFDMLNVLLVVTLLATIPWLKDRSWVSFVAYGFLVAILVNIRPTNAALLPAIAFLWLAANNTKFSVSSIIKNSITPRTALFFIAFLFTCGISIVYGEWFVQSSNSPPGVTLREVIPNIIFYITMSYTGWFGLITIAPFALLGLVQLWNVNRAYSIAFLYVILIWPVAHASFEFVNYRYILPILFLVLLLAAVGLSHLLRHLPGGKQFFGFAGKSVALFGVLIIGLYFMMGTGFVLASWSETASTFDAALIQEMGPALEDLGDGSILISAVNRGFQDSEGLKSLVFLDLVDHHKAWGVDDESLKYLSTKVSEKLDSGGRVFYLYSHWEAGHDFLGDGIEQYDRFFEGLNADFEMIERQRTTLKRSGYPWILYEVVTAP